MFKKKEKIKNTAIEEIEKIAEMVMRKIDYGFDILEAKNDLEKKWGLEKSRNSFLEIKTKEQQEDNVKLNSEIVSLKKNMDKLYEYLEKLAKVVKDYNADLKKEITKLKSNRYRVVNVKSTKETKQEIGLKSSAKTSKIIKNLKG